jgi:ketosteroid isomerase-like protein
MSDPVRDELEIRNLVARYSDAVARRDEKAWGDTWALDGEWKLGPNQATGRDDIVKLWTGMMKIFRFVTQFPASGMIEVSGDVATGRWRVLELGWPVQGDAASTIGVYEDRYRRTEEGWRFASRDFSIVYMGAPDLTGHLIGDPSAPLV